VSRLPPNKRWIPQDGLTPKDAAEIHLRNMGFNARQIGEFYEMRQLYEHAGLTQHQHNKKDSHR
jgi:hypothetical protein